jgi:hypothetical protein
LDKRRHPRYARILRGDVSELEDMLRGLFDMIDGERRSTGGRFVVLGIVPLAIFLDDPRRELDEIRQHLADWWQRRGQHIVRDADATRETGQGSAAGAAIL